MRYKCYSVFDSKVALYRSVMFFRNKGEAIRSFADAVANKDNLIGKYPEDFTLFEIAEWDDEDCKFYPYDALVSIAKGHELVPVVAESENRER